MGIPGENPQRLARARKSNTELAIAPLCHPQSGSYIKKMYESHILGKITA